MTCLCTVQAQALLRTMSEQESRVSQTVREKNNKGTPHFKIDVNIDQVQLFENTTSGSAIPILARIHSIGKHKVPVKMARPLLVGMYHGPGECIIIINIAFHLITDNPAACAINVISYVVFCYFRSEGRK